MRRRKGVHNKVFVEDGSATPKKKKKNKEKRKTRVPEDESTYCSSFTSNFYPYASCRSYPISGRK